MDIFLYRVLQAIAKGRIELRDNYEFGRYFPHASHILELKIEGEIIATARKHDSKPRFISVYGTEVRTENLYKLKTVLEEVKKREADKKALKKLMSYLAENSNSLTNK